MIEVVCRRVPDVAGPLFNDAVLNRESGGES